MNYYGPRRREDDGLWHYTCRNDGDIWPVGGCSVWETCPECEGRSFYSLRDAGYDAPTDCASCENKGVVRKAEPCPGHATPEEAREHMRQHLIETGIRLNASKTVDQQVRCDAEDCDEWTSDIAMVVGLGLPSHYHLCAAHMTEETVAGLITVGDVASS